MEDLASFAPIFKSEGFKEEKEWRIISEGPKGVDQVKYRSGQSYIIPYFEFILENPLKYLNSITIGPTPHPDISKNTLDMFLLTQKLECQIFEHEITVNHTNIPYRNW